MAADPRSNPTTNEGAIENGGSAPALDDVLPPSHDPAGASSKGYTADPSGQTVPVGEPVPLVPDSEAPRGIHVAERDDGVEPTGRSEEGEFTANDHLMGADCKRGVTSAFPTALESVEKCAGKPELSRLLVGGQWVRM